jgi:hypothetical protein
MEQWVSAAIGAGVGGVATFVGVAYSQCQLDRRDRRKAKKIAADSALISARIVQSELAWAKTRVSQARDRGRYWSAPYGLKEEAWLAYREQLAIAIDCPDNWSTVSDGFRWLRACELLASSQRKDDQLRPAVTPKGLEQLTQGLEHIEAAMETLKPLTKDPDREAVDIDPTSEDD